MTRRRKVSIPQAQLRAQRQEIGARVGMLLERYHALHVLQIELRVEWLMKPWPVRWVLWAFGKKPDFDEIIDERMEELDSKIVGPCTAQRHGAPCELAEGHDGPHQRESFGGEVISWEDEDESEGDG